MKKLILLFLLTTKLVTGQTNFLTLAQSQTNLLIVTNSFVLWEPTTKPIYRFETNEITFLKDGALILTVSNVVFVKLTTNKDTNGYSFPQPMLYFVPEKDWNAIRKALKEMEK